MTTDQKKSATWWNLRQVTAAAVITVLLFPILLPVLAILAICKLVVLFLIWILWLPRGKDVLVIYSNSPYWQSYFESVVIPQLEGRGKTLNWSERKKWHKRPRLRHLAFSAFPNSHEFNPAIILFRLWRWPQRFTFYQAFRDLKHGKDSSVKRILKELSEQLGEEVPVPKAPPCSLW